MAVGVRSSSSMRSSLRSTSSRRRRIRERPLVAVMDHQSKERKDEAPASTFDRGLILFTFALSGRVAGDVISRTSLGRTFLNRSDPVLGLVHLRQRFVC